MTSSSPIIERLSVEAFRGFRDLRQFDLSAAAVIVTGPNGTGKTSFFDALQWGFLGSLRRLEVLRSRRTDEHIVNQYRLGRKSTVEIDLRIASGLVTIRRIGDHASSTLELQRPGQESVFGAEAELELRNILLPYTELSLESALTTSGLMQQDVMRRVLEAKASDRYQQLSTVLGLAKLEDFEDAVRELARQAAERERNARAERDRQANSVRQAREELEITQGQVASRPSVIVVREQVRDVLSMAPEGVAINPSRVSLEYFSDVASLTAEFGSANLAIKKAQSLINQRDDIKSRLTNEPTDEELAALRGAVKTASEEASVIEAMRDALQMQLVSARNAAAEVAQLAALAVPMLSDQCPVCGQAIDRNHVESQLRERAETIGTILELQKAVEDRAGALLKAHVVEQSAREALLTAEVDFEKWSTYRSVDIEMAAHLSRSSEDSSVVHIQATTLDSLDKTGPVLKYLSDAWEALKMLLNAFEDETDQGAADRAMTKIRILEEALSGAEQTLTTESVRTSRLQLLSEHAVTARVEVTEARLNTIQPLVTNIYQRLDPHPAFKAVQFELATYYRKGTTSPLVTDAMEGVSADPLLVFSTSQANIVALSYFIAMSLSAESRGLPFLLLDDPIQSMDDVNVLGFADLCRHLRLRRQLIVSTHERRFAGLLERKLAPRAEGSCTKVIEFTGWDRSGPTVKQRVVDAQLLEDPIRLVQLAG